MTLELMSDEWLDAFRHAAHETLAARAAGAGLPARVVMEELFLALPPFDTDRGYRLVVEGGAVAELRRISALTGDADVAVTVDGPLAARLAALTHDDPTYTALRAEGEQTGAFSFTGDRERAAALGRALEGLHDRMATTPGGA